MRVNVYFIVDRGKGLTTSLMSFGDVKYTSYSGEWYSITLMNGTSHRWPAHRISSIEEIRK